MDRICRSICLLLPSPLLRRPLTEKDKVDEMTRKCQFAGRNYVLSKDVRTVACGRFAASNREGRAVSRPRCHPPLGDFNGGKGDGS